MFKYLIFILVLFSLKAHSSLMIDSLKYLSSDELQGRQAGTEKNKLATEYLKKQLEILKIEPFAESYLQEFTIFTGMEKNGENSLVINNSEVIFEPSSFSASGSISEADLVFVGFGITLPKSDQQFQYNDYENIDVKGKIVVALTGDPGIGNPNSPFRNADYMSYRTTIYKLKNAQMHEAAGIIFLNDPLSLGHIDLEPLPHFNPREGGGDRMNILAGYGQNKWFNSFSKVDTLSIQKKIAKEQKPHSFVMNNKANLNIHLKRKTGRVSNVLGFLPGNDEKLKKEIIVIGAHFDHLGLGGQSSMDPSPAPKIHNGADDNASGTSLVLDLAQKLVKHNFKRSVLIAFFNAEEIGLIGSKNLVSSWGRYSESYGKIKGMLNFDMVGRFQKEVALMGTGSAFEWNTLLSELNSRSTLPLKTKSSAVGSSDHASFINQDIPALFYTTGAHSDYHKSTDDFEKIQFPMMNKISHHAFELIQNLAKENTNLTFNPDARNGSGDGRERGYGAHLGCVPEFGQSDDIIGVLCVKTVPHSPAMIAGVVGGDVLTQIGDIEIKNIYDLAFALKYYRAGDKILLSWNRNGKTISTEIVLARSRRDGIDSIHSCHHIEVY